MARTRERSRARAAAAFWQYSRTHGSAQSPPRRTRGRTTEDGPARSAGTPPPPGTAVARRAASTDPACAHPADAGRPAWPARSSPPPDWSCGNGWKRFFRWILRPGQGGQTTRPDGLTGREAQVLRLLAAGHTNNEIAAQLVVSVHTIERHLQNAYRKIRVRNRADAAAYIVRQDGLIHASPGIPETAAAGEMTPPTAGPGCR